MEILAVFRSRSEAVNFAKHLDKKHIAHIIISTPMGLGFGCGLSVRFAAQFQNIALNIIRGNNFTTFEGFYHRN